MRALVRPTTICLFLLPLVACRPARLDATRPAPLPSTLAPAAPPAIAPELVAAVDTYRDIIVLLEGQRSLTPQQQAEADLVGRLLFQENRARLAALGAALAAEAAGQGPTPRIEAFVDALEHASEWHDADKLVFRDVVDDLLAALRAAGKGRTTLRTRLDEDGAALTRIQQMYDKELERIFGRFETRGLSVRRESWEAYVAFLRTRASATSVLAAREREARALREPRARAAAGLEIDGTRLPPRSLVLTFDDGPHPRHTDRILAILQQFGVPAVFFEVGENVGVPRAGVASQPTRAAAAARRLVSAGYPLANHSFSHAFLPRLSDAEIAREIDLTSGLLRGVTPGAAALFRPPYGARNAKVLAAVQARGLTSVLWNIDSRDWADPVPRSIANRAIATVDGEKRGIVLFHDIQARTVEALPDVLATLQERGYRFLAWNGSAFVDPTPPTAAARGAGGATSGAASPALYRESWAVVVGIDEYRHWPRLGYAVNDARAVHELLLRKFHFAPERVKLLLDGQATRANILAALGDALADPDKVAREDRVFVFFAGHGATRRLPSGRSLGYLVPVEADTRDYPSQAISMTNFQDVSEAIPAKHVLFVTDACYSGLALTRGGGDAGAGGAAYLAEVTRRPVRQILTAGGADQEVADNGPGGHSIFTWALLQGLEGRADLSGDGYVTASELAAYVGPTVSSLARQTPAFGNLVGSEGGEFVFELKHESEFLSDLSVQLDDEAIRLNSELDRVRAQIAAKRARNEGLRAQLARASGQLDGPATAGAAATGAPHNDRGMALYRERRYAEALAAFTQAAQQTPSSALFANNVGFAHYRMGQLDEAVTWFHKALALDPRRAVAWLNLGDALAALGDSDEARQAFDEYLRLQPEAKDAAEVRRKRDALR